MPSVAAAPTALNRVAPQANAAAEARSITTVIDANDGDGAFGLYLLDNGSYAVSTANLSSGTSLPDNALIVSSSKGPWNPGKMTPVALVEDDGAFRILMKSGEGEKAKYSVQSFNDTGLVSSKALALKTAETLAFEVEAGQDVNGDSSIGDVVASIIDGADVKGEVGLYALTSGKFVIDGVSKAVGDSSQNTAIALTSKGKAWNPGKAQVIGVQVTDAGYEVLLKTGVDPKVKYTYQAFDKGGVALDKAITTTAAALLDREVLYGTDFNADSKLGNVVVQVVDPTAPVEKPVTGTLVARSAKVGGEVFLGGRYIELGISAWGSMGTEGNKPAGFYGTTRNQIGMSADHDGFDVGQNLSVDYFMPGIPEERFAVGYRLGANTLANSNAALRGHKNMPTVVENTSEGRNLGARVSTTWMVGGNATMAVVQEISFEQDSLWFNNRVTITNQTSDNWDGARFMRSFDPDNTKDRGGPYSTDNTVFGRYETEGYSAVKAETYSGSDPLYTAFNGSRSPIILFSTDPRSVASAFGFANANPYEAAAYDTPVALNTTSRQDQGITMTWDTGTLKAGASASFDYYTSLDNRTAEAIISDIYGVGLYKLKSGDLSVGRAPAVTGDVLSENVLLKKSGKSWSPGKGAEAVAVRQTETGYQVTFKTGTGAKTKYFLQDFDAEGNTTKKPDKLTTATVIDLENTFEQDVNNDGLLGNRISGIFDAADPSGAAGLYRMAAGGIWLSEDNLELGGNIAPGAVEITKKGKSWVSGKETPLAVRINNTGLYELVTRAGAADKAKYVEYTIGLTGAFEGKPRTIKTLELADKETAYNQDLNGNGAIGS